MRDYIIVPLTIFLLALGSLIVVNILVMRRGRFLWYRDGLVSLLILAAVGLILWPIYVGGMAARAHGVHAERKRKPPQHSTPESPPPHGRERR